MRPSSSIVLPLIAFLMSVGAGAWLSTQQRGTALSTEADRRLLAEASSTAASATETKRAFVTDEEMLTAIMSAVALEEPLLRSRQLHETMGKLSSAELSVLFDKAVKVKDSSRRDPLIGALLARWAIVDLAAARTAVGPYFGRFRSATRFDWWSIETAVSQVWASVASEEALAAAIANPHGEWAERLAGWALASLSEGDPVRQLETLARMPDSRLRADLSIAAIRILAEKDFGAAEARLDLVTDPRGRSEAHAELLGAFASRDPAGGLARLADLAPTLGADTEGIRLVNEILFGAAKKDPEAALAAVDGLPEILRVQALSCALGGWADQDPAAALAWGVANGVDVMKAKGSLSFREGDGLSWTNVFTVAFDRDRERTLEWVRTQPPSPKRDSMLRESLYNGSFEKRLGVYADFTPEGRVKAAGDLVRLSLWHGRADAAQVESWVKDQPPGPVRIAAIQQLVECQVRYGSDRIGELTGAWSSGPDREASLRGIASALTNSNPQRALEFARQVSDSAARESAFENIADRWMRQDKSAARAWITSAPELSSEQKRVLLRQADEQ